MLAELLERLAARHHPGIARHGDRLADLASLYRADAIDERAEVERLLVCLEAVSRRCPTGFETVLDAIYNGPVLEKDGAWLGHGGAPLARPR